MDGHDGKVLWLTKHLPPGAAVPASLQTAGETALRRQRHTVAEADAEVRQADLPALRRLAWRCYGYTYSTAFYDLTRLTELFRNPCYLRSSPSRRAPTTSMPIWRWNSRSRATSCRSKAWPSATRAPTAPVS